MIKQTGQSHALPGGSRRGTQYPEEGPVAPDDGDVIVCPSCWLVSQYVWLVKVKVPRVSPANFGRDFCSYWEKGVRNPAKATALSTSTNPKACHLECHAVRGD